MNEFLDPLRRRGHNGDMCVSILLSVAAFAQAAAGYPRAFLKNNEIWIQRSRAASPVQVTHDGKAKSSPAVSPDGAKILYINYCVEGEGCTPNAVILDWNGVPLKRIERLRHFRSDRDCMSVTSHEWLSDDRIGIECHINPSLGKYLAIEIESGETVHSYTGFWFTWSPDRKTLAHVGFMVHFAPAFAHNYRLEFDDTTAYPPDGNETAQPDPRDARLYRDIHKFICGKPCLAWSPDSRYVALIDRIYDWHADAFGSYRGSESNPRYFLVVVSRDGRAMRHALSAVPRSPVLEWLASERLRLTSDGASETFAIHGEEMELVPNPH